MQSEDRSVVFCDTQEYSRIHIILFGFAILIMTNLEFKLKRKVSNCRISWVSSEHTTYYLGERKNIEDHVCARLIEFKGHLNFTGKDVSKTEQRT